MCKCYLLLIMYLFLLPSKANSNSDFSPKSLLDLTLKTVNSDFKMLLCKLRKTLWSSLSSR